MKKLISIGDLSKMLSLINPKNDKPLNHTLRYWEKEFKQIKPIKINKRRYYSQDQVEIIKFINFLLKNKGMTIKGVKNFLKSNINKLDDRDSYSLKAEYYNKKLKTFLKKLKTIKRYGKKISH